MQDVGGGGVGGFVGWCGVPPCSIRLSPMSCIRDVHSFFIVVTVPLPRIASTTQSVFACTFHCNSVVAGTRLRFINSPFVFFRLESLHIYLLETCPTTAQRLSLSGRKPANNVRLSILHYSTHYTVFFISCVGALRRRALCHHFHLAIKSISASTFATKRTILYTVIDTT